MIVGNGDNPGVWPLPRAFGRLLNSEYVCWIALYV